MSGVSAIFNHEKIDLLLSAPAMADGEVLALVYDGHSYVDLYFDGALEEDTLGGDYLRLTPTQAREVATALGPVDYAVQYGALPLTLDQARDVAVALCHAGEIAGRVA